MIVILTLILGAPCKEKGTLSTSCAGNLPWSEAETAGKPAAELLVPAVARAGGARVWLRDRFPSPPLLASSLPVRADAPRDLVESKWFWVFVRK